MDNERFEYLVFLCTPKKDDRQWNIGDAALEIFPMGSDQKNTGIYEKLKEFAQRVGMEFNTVLAYRQVASSFKPNIRVLASSFAVHQAMQGFPHLMREGLTVKQAMALVKAEKERLAEEARVRAEEAKRLAEEEAARQKAEDEARQVAEAQQRAREQRIRENAQVVEAEYQRGLANLLNDLSNIVYRFNEVGKAVRDLPHALRDEDMISVRSYLTKIQNKHEMFAEMLKSVDMDAELAKIMNEG